MIAEFFHSYQRSQAVGESTANYIAELTTHCAYGTHLDEALRDRLVCELHNVSIQKKLLSEADVILEQAVKIAFTMEAADRNAKSLKGKEAAVNSVAMGATGVGKCPMTRRTANSWMQSAIAVGSVDT